MAARRSPCAISSVSGTGGVLEYTPHRGTIGVSVAGLGLSGSGTVELQEATRSLNAQVEKATDCPLVVTQDASIRTPSMLRMASDSCSLSWEHTMKTRTVKNTKGTVGKVIPYTAKIIKAGALLADTKTLLSHWDTATSVKANLARIRQENLFGKASRSRVEDILAIFRQRYLTDEDVAKALVVFVQNRLPAASLDRILFFHSARADRLLHDAVTELLLPLKTRGATDVDVLEVQRAIAKWVAQGKARGKAPVPAVTLENDQTRLLLEPIADGSSDWWTRPQAAITEPSRQPVSPRSARAAGLSGRRPVITTAATSPGLRQERCQDPGQGRRQETLLRLRVGLAKRSDMSRRS